MTLEIFNAVLKMFASTENSSLIKSYLSLMEEQQLEPDEVTFVTCVPARRPFALFTINLSESRE